VKWGEDLLVLIGDRDKRSYALISDLVTRLGLQAELVRTGQEVLDAAQDREASLVVLSLQLTEPSAFEVCRSLREQHGERLPIVFVADDGCEERDEVAALLLGADDFFTKPLPEDRFLARVRRLLAGAAAQSPRLTLSPREQEVLELLAEGRRPAEIAEDLCITTKTASTHIEHILSKLGAHSQAQAVAFALRDGLTPSSSRRR
jgi:DNA-binding NarL/FixJ family response regulator